MLEWLTSRDDARNVGGHSNSRVPEPHIPVAAGVPYTSEPGTQCVAQVGSRLALAALHKPDGVGVDSNHH